MNKEELVDQLLNLGVRVGGVLVVHTSFSQVGPVAAGPWGLIAALRAALGPDGTLVMPSLSSDDDQPFDPLSTPCAEMGVVAEMFWQLPGVLRSDSPHAFAAIGSQAEAITQPHPRDTPHGIDSPVGRVYEMDGQVLLLGVGHDANTTIHLAENLAGVRYRRKHDFMIWEVGKMVRFEYGEVDHCCENFNLMDGWLEAKGLQRRGPVGHGEGRLIRSRDVVSTAMEKLAVDETAFLHPYGVDHQCDEARDSIKEFKT